MLGRHLAPVVFADVGALGDTDQRVVRFVVTGRTEITFIGRHQRDALGVGEVDELRLGFDLALFAVPLQLDIEPVAEQGFEQFQARQGQLRLTVFQCPIDRPVRTAGEGDQTVAMLFQIGALDVRRFDAGGAQMRPRRELHQVGVAGIVHGVEREHSVAVRMSGLHAALAQNVVLARFGKIDGQRHTGDRLHASACQLVGKFQRAEHVVGVGEAERRHAGRGRELGELGDRQRAFEQRIGRVHLEVHELRRRGDGRGACGIGCSNRCVHRTMIPESLPVQVSNRDLWTVCARSQSPSARAIQYSQQAQTVGRVEVRDPTPQAQRPASSGLASCRALPDLLWTVCARSLTCWRRSRPPKPCNGIRGMVT